MSIASSSRTCLRSLCSFRTFHTSSPVRDLVGPPDPVSNLRPVIYDDLPAPSPATAPRPSRAVTGRQHPYSLSEFALPTSDEARNSARDDYGAYQLRMHQQQLDAFNHAYWMETNTRFEAAKSSVLSSLPSTSSPEAREAALSRFYRHWVRQEATRSATYSAEWHKRNWAGLALAARVRYRALRARFGIL